MVWLRNKKNIFWYELTSVLTALNFTFLFIELIFDSPDRIAQSVMFLATDASLTADPGVANPIWVRSHTFMEIDHDLISTVILLPSAESSRRVVVSYKRKYVHEVLVNCLFKHAQEKMWLGELTVPP